MTATTDILGRGWEEIQARFLESLRAAAEGGDTGAWSSGLKALAGTDFVNATTGRTYNGAFNRAILAARVGSRLDRRVATARQIEKAGHSDPAAFGLAAHAAILAPIPLKGGRGGSGAEDSPDDEDEDRGRVAFRTAEVFSIDVLRRWIAADGSAPWAGLPAWEDADGDSSSWIDGERAQEALSMAGALCSAWGIPYEEGSFKSPHVALIGGEPRVRMPAPGMQAGEEDEKLSNRLASFFHEAAHWTGFGGAGEELRRDMSGSFGDLAYAREELIAETAATRMAAALGLERTEGFLARQAAYVGGWAKPLLAAGGLDAEGLLRKVCEDADRIAKRMLGALSGHPFVVAAAEREEALRSANAIPEASEAFESEIPDWRDADGMDALTPAQVERARKSFEAKKARKSPLAADGFEAFVARGQKKRIRRAADADSGRRAETPPRTRTAA